MNINHPIPRELSAIDIVMCTCNSDKPWFKKCLKSIRNEIPVHCFIVVDCYSQDETIQIVKQFFPNAKIIQTKTNLGQARKIGFQQVDTPWFAFIDDDIELQQGWFKRIISHVGKNVGTVAGIAIETNSALEKFAYLRIGNKWLMLHNKNIVTKENPDIIRGLTHNTLCRKEAVDGWAPPSSLAAYEDHHLLRYIVNKGFKWISVTDAKVKHHGIFTCRSQFRKAKWNGAGSRMIAATSLWRLLKKTIYIAIITTYGSLKIHNPSIVTISFSAHLGNIVGYLRWNKYTSSYANARS